MSNVDAVIKKFEKYADLPDGWIFAGTDINVGDVRLLITELETVRSSNERTVRRRAELLTVATALESFVESKETSLFRAIKLIDDVDFHIANNDHES